MHTAPSPVRRRARHRALALVLGLVALTPSAASAQDADTRARDLNREAMDLYQNLEFERAEEVLREALRLSPLRPATGARLQLSLGVVLAGNGNTDGATAAFAAGLAADPTVTLDPMVSTPDIVELFEAARARGTGGGGSGGIPHEPPREQLVRTPLPIFVPSPPGGVQVTGVELFYRNAASSGFRRVEMLEFDAGFGFEIPCAEVTEPEIQYFITARGADGSVIGTAGSEDAPIGVPIVDVRTGPPPAFPGFAPPAQCRTEAGGLGDPCRGESSCRPGLECVDGFCGTETARRSCESSDDCLDDQECVDEVCVAPDDEDSDEDSDEEGGGDGEAPRFFAHLGGVLGLALLGDGLPADGGPIDMENNADHYIEGGTMGCDLPVLDPPDYCVSLQDTGFTADIALRATFGYYVTERIAIAVGARFQPVAGRGTLASLLLQGRVQYLFTEPAREGLAIAAFVGGGFGQIQPHPPRSEPFVRSGLNAASFGGAVSYRVTPAFGFHVTPEVILMFPSFLFDIDLTMGVELAL